jgi:hypothetical protein
MGRGHHRGLAAGIPIVCFAGHAPPERRSMKILVVEDDAETAD